MDFWQYEWASNQENRQVLIRSKGFCPRHTWQLTQLEGLPIPFTLAIVYRSILPDLLTDVQRDLERTRADRAPGRVRFWQKLWKRGRDQANAAPEVPLFQACPFCQRQVEIERSLIQTLLTNLPFEEFQTRLTTTTGFCLGHFTQALHTAKNNEQRAILLTCQQTSLRQTLDELEELVRKHDYRFLQEPRGKEMTSWRRAAELLVGNRGVR